MFHLTSHQTKKTITLSKHVSEVRGKKVSRPRQECLSGVLFSRNTYLLLALQTSRALPSAPSPWSSHQAAVGPDRPAFWVTASIRLITVSSRAQVMLSGDSTYCGARATVLTMVFDQGRHQSEAAGPHSSKHRRTPSFSHRDAAHKARISWETKTWACLWLNQLAYIHVKDDLPVNTAGASRQKWNRIIC